MFREWILYIYQKNVNDNWLTIWNIAFKTYISTYQYLRFCVTGYIQKRGIYFKYEPYKGKYT